PLPEDGELRPEPDWPLIEAALAAISPEERERYVLWSRITMALHSTGSPRAFEIAEKWSKGPPEDRVLLYDRAELVAKWKSYGRNDGPWVGIGTIFHEASLRGWIDPRRTQPVAIGPISPTALAGLVAPRREWLIPDWL